MLHGRIGWKVGIFSGFLWKLVGSFLNFLSIIAVLKLPRKFYRNCYKNYGNSKSLFKIFESP
jgi:hypothetical protein